MFKAEIKLKINEIIIFFIIDLITNLALKPYIIVYNSKAKILLVTYFHFVNNKSMIFALLNWLARQITYFIWLVKLKLFAKDVFVKITNFRLVKSSCIKQIS